MQGFPNCVSYNLLTEERVLDFLSLLSASINYDWISKSCWNLVFVPVTLFKLCDPLVISATGCFVGQMMR